MLKVSFLLLAHPNSPGGIKPPTVTSLILVAVFYGVQRMGMRMPPEIQGSSHCTPSRERWAVRQTASSPPRCLPGSGRGMEISLLHGYFPCTELLLLVLILCCHNRFPSLCKQAWHFRKTGERGGLRDVPSLCPPSAQGQPPSWKAPLHSSLYFLYILHYILKKSKRSTLEER